MCFINHSKAFDCVEHYMLWKVLQILGTSPHLIQLKRSPYTDQEAVVRMQYCDTEWFRIERGVRQGCILSPFIFRVNPNSLSYSFPLVLHVHVRVSQSRFDRGVGVRGRGRYSLKPSISASLLETKEYPEHTAARSYRESQKCKYFRHK